MKQNRIGVKIIASQFGILEIVNLNYLNNVSAVFNNKLKNHCLIQIIYEEKPMKRSGNEMRINLCILSMFCSDVSAAEIYIFSVVSGKGGTLRPRI